MKENRNTGRRCILVILVLYLAALAVFTFASDSILNQTVPHVKSCRVASAYIKETYYDKTVPATAYCFDEKHGCYIFEVVRKMTPLGERCYLNRISVKLIETDDMRGISAISARMTGGEEIVMINSPEYRDSDIVVVERSGR